MRKFMIEDNEEHSKKVTEELNEIQKCRFCGQFASQTSLDSESKAKLVQDDERDLCVDCKSAIIEDRISKQMIYNETMEGTKSEKMMARINEPSSTMLSAS